MADCQVGVDEKNSSIGGSKLQLRNPYTHQQFQITSKTAQADFNCKMHNGIRHWNSSTL
jgi:hypothetical protein